MAIKICDFCDAELEVDDPESCQIICPACGLRNDCGT